MRIKLIILTILLLFFGVRPTYAVTVTTSNVPPSISDQPFTVDVSVSGAGAGTNYLRIDLYKDGTTNYFGETYNGTNYYGGSDGKQYFPITILSGQTWSGSIQGRVGSPTATEFPGAGSYKLRVRRYTSSGNPSSGDTQTPQDINITLTSSSPSPQSSSPLPSSSSSSTSSSSSSAFSISNTPSQIDSTETFSVVVNLSIPNSPNTIFYLKGAFKKADSSNYFGLTKVSGAWIKNNKTYLDQYKITTDSNGNWSGNLEIQPDILDSGYEGAGDYVFKVGRYTESGSLSWSNEVMMKINAQEVTLDESVANTPQVLGIDEKPSKRIVSSKSRNEELSQEKYIKVASPASITQPTATPQKEATGERKINYLSRIGLFLLIIGISVLAFVYLRNKNLHEKIFDLFGKRD